MIVDARQVPAGTEIEADLCIVGAGAAGITLAREFIGGPARVCLLESGGFEFEDRTQALYEGTSLNPSFAPLDATRLRYFGGSTNHWNGLCRPLEPVDFAKRDYIRESGWPFPREELDPFYLRAQEICELGPPTFEAADWAKGDRKAFALDGDRFFTCVFQNGPPTRFGTVYREALEKAENVKVYLHANVVDIETPPSPNEVSRLQVATLDGNTMSVQARIYVLAAGGLENARLLLNADKVQTGGLGNGNGLVGRYFMDHPEVWRSGNILFAKSFPELGFYGFNPTEGTSSFLGAFMPTQSLLDRERLPNFYIALAPGTAVDQSEGMASVQAIWTQVKRGSAPDDLGKHLGNILGDLGGIAGAAYDKITDREVPLYSTLYFCETAPDPDSRITLLDERDELGLRRIQLDWRVGDDFEANYLRAHQLLAEEIGRAGLGRVKINTRDSALDPTKIYANGHHHIGATRMSDDPKRGVTDAVGRVHGIGNLYVTGSSVFPTGGCGPPTLTIVAMALRLADHLKSGEGPLSR